VYHRKAAEAKLQHSINHPGWQYQPRKPSEKKKRMTKNKLAKLAAAKKPAPLLTFNKDKSTMSFVPGQGAPSQLTAEFEAFNNSKWPAGPPAHLSPAALGQIPLPTFASSQFVTNPVNMNDILYHPGPTTVKNYFASVEQAAFSDPSSDSNYQATLALPALDDFDVFFDGLGNVNTQDLFLTEDGLNAEVLRQGALNEEFKDGLNDFFDFDRFE
jgi:hypothetical protein